MTIIVRLDLIPLLSDLNGPTVVIDSTNDAGCFGESNGGIFITASGNNPPFVYNWLPNGQNYGRF